MSVRKGAIALLLAIAGGMAGYAIGHDVLAPSKQPVPSVAKPPPSGPPPTANASPFIRSMYPPGLNVTSPRAAGTP